MIVAFYLFINRLKEDIGRIAETGCIVRLLRVCEEKRGSQYY